MFTKKTRALSAVAAVFMLLSLVARVLCSL